MPVLTPNRSFFYSPFSGVSNPVKRSKSPFDQGIAFEEPKLDTGASSFMLDSLSEIIRQQSLSQEQIAKSRIKRHDMRISAALKTFSVTNFDEIKLFVERNSYLISLIEEIPSKIFEYFKEESLSLELIADPDFPQSSELWVSVVTNKTASNARPIMNLFDNVWWFENLDRAQCKLNITLEYV